MSACALAREHLHVGVLDLPAAGHLLDDELRVHAHVHGCLRVALEGGLEAGDQPAVLGDVVARDADVDADLAEHRAGSSSMTTAPPAAMPGLPREPPSASTMSRGSQTGLLRAHQDAAALGARDDGVLGRQPRSACRSVPASTMRHPSHVPRRRSAAPALRAATLS